MEIEFDPTKRQKTLDERELDFNDAAKVFAGFHLEENRTVTTGELDGVIVVLVWTLRDNRRRIISLRKANADETQYYLAQKALG